MKITNVIKHEEIKLTQIHIEHNGMEAYYYASDSLNHLFANNIDEFMTVFFDNGEINWRDVCDDNVLEFFSTSVFLKNKEYEKRRFEDNERYMEVRE